MRQKTALFLALASQALITTKVFAWGETGHNVVGRVAAKIVADDDGLLKDTANAAAVASFSGAVVPRYTQMGHLANIPDIHWKSFDGEDAEDVRIIGDYPHFFNSDIFVDSATGDYKISLDYEEAKRQYSALRPTRPFFQNGSLPWRTQQLYNLYVWNLKTYPQDSCSVLSALPNHPTRTAFAYAGIMTHYTGDISQPYHATKDYDGIETNQKGLHSYFESTMVDALEFGLDKKVYDRAKELLNGNEHKMHSVAYFHRRAEKMFTEIKPGSEMVALTMAVANDSLYHKKTIAEWDAKYAVATAKEAWENPSCSSLTLVKDLKLKFDAATTEAEKATIAATKIMSAPGPGPNGALERACRRDVETLVDKDGNLSPRGRPVKAYFEKLIVERIAIGAAITAHIWIQGWEDAGRPKLCSTYQYALKPSFVSPTDANCFGYALQESPNDFLKADGTSALPWKHPAPSTDKCISF